MVRISWANSDDNCAPQGRTLLFFIFFCEREGKTDESGTQGRRLKHDAFPMQMSGLKIVTRPLLIECNCRNYLQRRLH